MHQRKTALRLLSLATVGVLGRTNIHSDAAACKQAITELLVAIDKAQTSTAK
jgi:hypothetical protein